MPVCTLLIEDQVNVKLVGVDPFLRRKINEALKFMIPSARHTPAFKLGRWDGKKSFGTVAGATYINMLDRVLPLLDAYDIEIDDRRPQNDFVFPEVSEDMLADRVWPDGHVKAGQPIVLRDYQAAAIERYLENLQSIQCLATGSGKTVMTAALSLLIEPYGRSIIIVPSKSLITQTEEDYRNLGLDVGVFYGDSKEWSHKHTICTWQSLAIFSKKSKTYDPEFRINEFLKDVVCVIVDECHKITGSELQDLLCGPMAHIPIRWGLTGTIPKEDYQSMSLLVSVGQVVGEIKASDLQEVGVLANCHVSIMQLDDSHVEFKDYDEEFSFISTDTNRLAWIAKFCKELAAQGNTLVLVDHIETGEKLQLLIPDSVFVNGAVKNKRRTEHYKNIQITDNVPLIATYGVASTGINIPRLFNVVIVSAGKSFTKVMQSLGRGLRMAEDKDYVDIFDVCSNLKFDARHLTIRKKFYKEAKFPFEVQKVDYRSTIVI